MTFNFIDKAFQYLFRFFNELKDRRIHVVAAYYYIGAWQVLEPLIAVFGFEQDTLRLIKNVVVSLLPLVLVFTWFHGKPKKQPISKLEGIIYLPTVLLAALIYLSLPGLPKPTYTVLVQDVQRERQFFFAEQLNQFATKNGVTLQLRHFDSGANPEMMQLFQFLADSSQGLLALVPLNYAGILMNHKPALLQSYDEVLLKMASAEQQNFATMLAKFDSTALRFSRRMQDSDEYLFLPFEFDVPVLVYFKSKLQEAVQSWSTYKDEINSVLLQLAGTKLPADFILEANPNLWDFDDLFVASYYWNQAYPTPNSYGRLAFPGRNDGQSFMIWINRALGCGVSWDELFNLSANLNLPSAALVETFFKDALFRESKLCQSAMWLEAGVSHLEVVELLKTKSIFAAFLPSSDLFALNSPEILADIQVASLPRINGAQFYSALPNLMLLAIPKRSPKPVLSLQLAQWLTGTEQQLLRASNQFSLPTVTNLMDFSVKPPFRPPLKMEIWQSLINQFEEFRGWSFSPFNHFDETDYFLLTDFYYKKWQEIVVGRSYLNQNGEISRELITAALIAP